MTLNYRVVASGEIPISKWSGLRFNSCYEIFSLHDGKKLDR